MWAAALVNGTTCLRKRTEHIWQQTDTTYKSFTSQLYANDGTLATYLEANYAIKIFWDKYHMWLGQTSLEDGPLRRGTAKLLTRLFCGPEMGSKDILCWACVIGYTLHSIYTLVPANGLISSLDRSHDQSYPIKDHVIEHAPLYKNSLRNRLRLGVQHNHVWA